MLQRPSAPSTSRLAAGALFAFAFVFNVELSRPEGLSLSLLAMVLGLFVGLVRGHFRLLRGHRVAFAFALAVPALYIATFQSALRATDANMLALLYLKTVVFVVVGTSVFHSLFLRDLGPGAAVNFLFKSVVWAFVAQACFVFVSFQSPAFRSAIDLLLTAKGNLTGLEGFRVKGLANSGGANLSMAMCFAAMMSAYLALRGEGRRYGVAALFIIASSSLVGRSGILGFAAAAALFFLHALATGSFSRTRLLGRLTLGAVTALGVQAALGDLDDSVALWWSWFSGQAGDSVGEVWEMYSHDFTLADVLVGKGYFETETSGNDRSDVGYIKTLFSVGLPAALLFYGGLVLLYGHGARAFVAITRRDVLGRLLVLLMILLVFFFESKEAMAYQNFTGRLMLFSFVLFAGLRAAARVRRPFSHLPFPKPQRCAE